MVVLCLALMAAPATQADDGDVRMATVASVAGRPVTAADLASYWFSRYPEEYRRTLDALIDERVVEREARRHGIAVPAPVLDTAVREEVAARKAQLQRAYGEEANLAREIHRAYGLDVAAWRRTVLRPRMHSQLLLERVVRWDTRRRARVHVRVIVRSDAASARALAARLRSGADFGLTAMRESLDPTAKTGGDLPPIARGDLAFPAVEAALFPAKRGALVGPLAVTVDGRQQWHLYKVIRHLPPWSASAPDAAKRLEQDLRDHPFSRGEYERWRARAVAEHGVTSFRPGGR